MLTVNLDRLYVKRPCMEGPELASQPPAAGFPVHRTSFAMLQAYADGLCVSNIYFHIGFNLGIERLTITEIYRIFFSILY